MSESGILENSEPVLSIAPLQEDMQQSLKMAVHAYSAQVLGVSEVFRIILRRGFIDGICTHFKPTRNR